MFFRPRGVHRPDGAARAPDGFVRETFSLPLEQDEVRETRTLFRLTPAPDHDLSRSSRQVAIVAAETEDKARQIDFLASDAIVDPTPDGAFQILPVQNII